MQEGAVPSKTWIVFYSYKIFRKLPKIELTFYHRHLPILLDNLYNLSFQVVVHLISVQSYPWIHPIYSFSEDPLNQSHPYQFCHLVPCHTYHLWYLIDGLERCRDDFNYDFHNSIRNYEGFSPENPFNKHLKLAWNHDQIFQVFLPHSNDFNMLQHVLLSWEDEIAQNDVAMLP